MKRPKAKRNKTKAVKRKKKVTREKKRKRPEGNQGRNGKTPISYERVRANNTCFNLTRTCLEHRRLQATVGSPYGYAIVPRYSSNSTIILACRAGRYNFIPFALATILDAGQLRGLERVKGDRGSGAPRLPQISVQDGGKAAGWWISNFGALLAKIRQLSRLRL